MAEQTLYRRWLVRYGVHLGVALAHANGTTSLAEIREECELLDVLEGFERKGDLWLADVCRLGPFHPKADGRLALFRGVAPGDFPHPGAPPPLMDPPPVEREPEPATPLSPATGRRLRKAPVAAEEG